ncbi:MAG: ATP-binding domain-containing protein, partial [Myxococcota bacterium]|nr:ATP-binding domain-containing protein [Myxococcota bacterium]
LVDVRLDPAQREVIGLPPERTVLVLGEAGHGKTTVALHRLAHVWRASKGDLRAAVVVPTEGLARLVQPLLRRLGVDVEAVTYERWARTEARRAFRDLPRQESELTPAAVQRVKRDGALRSALALLARRPPGRVDDDVDARPSRSRALARRGDLQHLFGDRTLLEALARESGSITPRAIDEVLDHTRLQFALTAERDHADVVDRQRLIAVDGRRLDEGTSTANAGAVDAEDYAVLFELDRLRAELLQRAPATPRSHDVLVIDEAQELAPLELALLGRGLAKDGTLVVAGDIDQQTDVTTRFGGWAAAMTELGRPDYATVHLDVSYRCPPAVTSLARSVLAGDAPSGPRVDAPRDHAPEESDARPSLRQFPSEQQLGERLAREIASLRRRDPRASVAVICRSPLTARRIAAILQAHAPTRLVFDGHFLPRGPAQVTTVDEVKGLEFDFVVVPDATASDYPDAPAARRALYVAVTRARHQVFLAHVGPRSPLVASGPLHQADPAAATRGG